MRLEVADAGRAVLSGERDADTGPVGEPVVVEPLVEQQRAVEVHREDLAVVDNLHRVGAAGLHAVDRRGRDHLAAVRSVEHELRPARLDEHPPGRTSVARRPPDESGLLAATPDDDSGVHQADGRAGIEDGCDRTAPDTPWHHPRCESHAPDHDAQVSPCSSAEPASGPLPVSRSARHAPPYQWARAGTWATSTSHTRESTR